MKPKEYFEEVYNSSEEDFKQAVGIEDGEIENHNLPDEVKTKIFESLGTASMCWSEIPSGVFDSDLALKIGNELCDFIYDKMQPRENNPTA